MPEETREDRARSYANIIADMMLVHSIGTSDSEVLIRGAIFPDYAHGDIRKRLAGYRLRSVVEDLGDSQLVRIQTSRTAAARIPVLPIVLFLTTVLTTLAAGALMEGAVSPADIVKGIPFSATLIGILGVHELGHYFASKKNNVAASLPYFIPAPTWIGTFGAFIKIKSPILTRRSLMEIGASGPIAGFLVAVPALYLGLSQSQILPASSDVGIHLGDSLILMALSRLALPPVPQGFDIYLNSVAFAGWIGLLVTALNLLPIGQLDGGHIAYALFGKKHVLIARFAFLPLIPLGFLSVNWLVWAALIYFVVRLRHPPVVDEVTPLDARHRLAGWASLVIFIVCFTPVPFS